MAETTEQYRNRINQLKTGIENEPYIKKMRENIAEGISKTGNRQADIEDQFQEVIDNTTGKDVIAAPELIAARNGETNLKARLDKEKQEVTAQLAQIENEKASQSDLTVVESRMDAFTKLPEGSTTGDAELSDIRTGILGLDYGLAGKSVRQQLNNIISTGVTSKTFRVVDESTGTSLTIDKEMIKGQTIRLSLSASSTIIDPESLLNFGLRDMNNVLIPDVVVVKSNISGEYTVPRDCKQVALWLPQASIIGTGDVTINVSYPKGIHESLHELEDDSKLVSKDVEIIKNEIGEMSKHNGKATFSIISDSYSTYEGWIPEGYSSWYSDDYTDQSIDRLTSVKDTWFWQLSKVTGMKLLTNSSFSGSTICNTGYNGIDSSSSSFVTRVKKDLGEKKSLESKPDVIFTLGGTNDDWANAPIGTLKYSGWTEDDLKSVLPAFCYLLNYIQLWNPQATIINIVNTGLDTAIITGMQTACDYYGVKNLNLTNIGKEAGHPNKAGMIAIKDQVVSIMNQ